jgi:mono/diheme cytochrome c family protein
MKKRKMTRQGVFNFWSVMLLLAGAAAVYREYTPQYRAYQTKFREVTLEIAEEEIERENARIETMYKSRLEELDRKIQAATDEVRSVNQQERIREQEELIRRLEHEEYEAGQKLSFAKSIYGSSRSIYEFLRNDKYASPAEVAAAERHYNEIFALVLELTPPADAAYDRLTQAKEDLKAMQVGPAPYIRERDSILSELNAWRAEVEQINPSDVVRWTANAIRDVPLLDLIEPKYNLNQVVLEDFPDLTETPKVDRCTTCHLGIADARYDRDDIPNEFRAHPKLDLYVGADSPHPVEKFGCTTCHLGRGYGTTFNLAAHTPNDEEQEKEWKDKYAWKPVHHWDYPMLPSRLSEANCFTCHKPNTGYELTQARKIFEGRQLFERRGCHGCHMVDGVTDDMKKIGPSLLNVADKLSQEWSARWIASPRDFYEDARMPHAFGHKIPSDSTFPEFLHHIEEKYGKGYFDEQRAEMIAEEAVVIDSIATFLFEKSGHLEMDEPPAEEGDAAVGRELVGKVNCLACHQLTDLGARGENYGPDLSKIGSKTNRKWLYNWLRDPKKYWPDGNMPDPRLSDEEANHITAYLLTLRDDEYMEKNFPSPTSEKLEEIAVQYLRARTSKEEAVAQVTGMSEHERKLLIGEEAVYRNGCFGCHNIAGFETRGRIGAELTAQGKKEIELFDFGSYKYVHLPHFRHDWIEAKVKQPQLFFLGKVLNPYEQTLAMPWFGFTDEEAQKITTFVLGQTGDKIPEAYRYDPVGAKKDILEGRKLIERLNCQGCHQIGLGEQYVKLGEFDVRRHLAWVTDPLIAKHDPNLPEGRFSVVAQVRPDKVGPNDRVILPRDGFIDGDVIFGNDYFGMDELLGEETIQVDVGATDAVRVALERPETLRVNGIGEGGIAQYYSEAALAPPILRNQGMKTRPEWFFKFLKHITPVRNHIEVRMPQWDWTDEDATTIVRYFAAASTDIEPFPYKTEDVQPLGDYHRRTATELFGLPGTEAYRTSLQCFSCHPAGDLMPTTPRTNWGPDLNLASERLKISFMESWLRYPMGWSPGTRMPAFFYDREGGVLHEVPPASPAVAERGTEGSIQALAELLYYLPEMQEVADAAAAEAERQRLAPPPAAVESFEDDEFDDEFMEFDDFDDF